MMGESQDGPGLDQDKNLIIMVRYIAEEIVIVGGYRTYSVPCPGVRFLYEDAAGMSARVSDFVAVVRHDGNSDKTRAPRSRK
jgi:hypothetical protein